MRFFPTELIEQMLPYRPKPYYKDLIDTGTALYDQKGAMRGVLLTKEEHHELSQRYSEVPPASPPSPQEGAGTELKKLLAMIGITSSPGCACNARAIEMDKKGVEWCRKNVSEIVVWLQSEAKKRNLPFSRFAARKIVQIAIARAARKEAKSN